jgi:hypothetical protein
MDEHTNMTERVLGTIERQGVTPKPRWHFLLHEWVVWGVAGALFAVGSVATALTLYIAHASFLLEGSMGFSDLARIVTMLPWIWALLIGVAVFYTMHAIATTEYGYKWHRSYVVGLALALSVLCGYFLYSAGLSEKIDRYLLAEVELYRPMSGFYPEHWMNPAEGRWVGVVMEPREGVFTLSTLDGAVWEVYMSDTTRVHGFSEIAPHTRVRVVGTTTEIGICEAYEVRPFRGRGGAMRAPPMVPVEMEQSFFFTF